MFIQNTKRFGTLCLAGAFAIALPVGAQQYPPPQQQYPPQQGQYPPQQGQYPPQQGQYPPQQGQYPPQQGQYPAQGQYPDQYPPQQPYYGQQPQFAPQQLEDLVSRIALYPDPLLAQVLTASTFPDQIPQAAAWANQHRFLQGDALARAISEDRLPWDPSVVALIPFPNVLDMLARDPGWSQQLGSAVLANRAGVMEAVQHMRQRAYDYGYLRDNQYDRVVTNGPGLIQIVPVDPGYYYVPQYNPTVVYYRPRPGFFVGGAISFGPRVFIGTSFAPWGWSHPYIDWRGRSFVIDNRPWDRTWVNRERYVHSYEVARPRFEGGRVEHHEREFHRDERRDDRRERR